VNPAGSNEADPRFMRLALDAALSAQAAGEPPFGALVVGPGGEPLALTADSVVAARDLTQHAETNAVRLAASRRGPDLAGCTLYATCEPCPMCFTAAWLARIDRLVIGCTMAEVQAATGGAQRELVVPAAEMNRLGGGTMAIVYGVLAADCLAPFTAPRGRG
jgi:tRNA(adenine34) deaminase